MLHRPDPLQNAVKSEPASAKANAEHSAAFLEKELARVTDQIMLKDDQIRNIRKNLNDALSKGLSVSVFADALDARNSELGVLQRQRAEILRQKSSLVIPKDDVLVAKPTSSSQSIPTPPSKAVSGLRAELLVVEKQLRENAQLQSGLQDIIEERREKLRLSGSQEDFDSLTDVEDDLTKLRAVARSFSQRKSVLESLLKSELLGGNATPSSTPTVGKGSDKGGVSGPSSPNSSRQFHTGVRNLEEKVP